MRINTSIHDFSPLFKEPEYLFKGLKETGVYGIELTIGFKSRWSVKHYKSLSKKYDLPIVSLHQPVWSWLDVYYDEKFFDIAEELDITKVVCHPLPKTSFRSKQMKDYLQKLAAIQETKGIEVLLENLPKKYNHKLVNQFFPPNEDAGNIMTIYEAASEFGLQITLDIDHLQSAAPHEEKWFQTVYPKIANVHLSSFGENKKHLPLYLGDFRSVSFMQHLKKLKYQGLLTFEINSPGLITFFNYDFEAIKKSVELIKSNARNSTTNA